MTIFPIQIARNNTTTQEKYKRAICTKTAKRLLQLPSSSPRCGSDVRGLFKDSGDTTAGSKPPSEFSNRRWALWLECDEQTGVRRYAKKTGGIVTPKTRDSPFWELIFLPKRAQDVICKTSLCAEVENMQLHYNQLWFLCDLCEFQPSWVEWRSNPAVCVCPGAECRCDADSVHGANDLLLLDDSPINNEGTPPCCCSFTLLSIRHGGSYYNTLSFSAAADSCREVAQVRPIK